MISIILREGYPGTKLGDPIEISALGEAFAYNTNQKKLEYKCVIGSVKANIGHADVAAGIAGLIKICKMLEHKIMPKQINYDTPNSELYLNDTNFEIITETRGWDKINNRLRMAAVSSFGIGGTNAHIIISEYISDNKNVIKTSNEEPKRYVLPLSAKSKTSLEAYKNNFIGYLTNTTDSIGNIAYTLQLKREHFNYRLAIASDSINEEVAKLKGITNIAQISHSAVQPSVIFMFPGQNSQYANMSIELYKTDHDYKKIIDECIKLVNKYTQAEFEKILFPALFNNEMSKYDINQTEWSQLAIFIVEYALAKLLETLNIHADGYIGHSIGEYVAATLTGVFSLEDAIKLVIARGQLMQSMPKGAMLSIQASVIAVKQIVADNRCEIATVNSPQNCTASGTHTDIKNLNIELDKIAIPSIVLNVSHAFHSHFMADAARKFIYKFKQVKLNSPTINFISNVTGDFITGTDAVNPEYWASHIRNPVLLSDGIKALYEHYNNPFFIEVGTGKSLISFVKQHSVTSRACVQLMNSYKDYLKKIPDLDCRESILSKLWINGYNVKFSDHVYDDCRVVKLPHYCFDSFSYWQNQSSNTSASVKSQKQVLKESSFGIMDIKSKVVEQDQPEKYYDIAKIFIELLGIEKVSIHDDFFNLGGDSLLAVSLATKLQHNYEINLTDIFNLRTIAKIADSAIYAKDNLRRKLEQVKATYKKSKALMHDESSDKYQQYLQNIELSSKFSKKYKNIHSVLLTGATGHVGCNLLYQLLHETKYKIYLLVRADSEEQAINRINSKYRYYFSKTLDYYKDRVVILSSDIEKLDLGLNATKYQELVNNVDSIIHCAALAKHYGNYALFCKANVQTTINMLELSRQTKNKDFHYISTIAVLVYGYVPNCSYYIFSEDDNSDILLGRSNVYAKSKYEGEVVSLEYRRHGVATNIYRLGNVAMHSTSYLHQENIEDNAFFVIAKTIQDFGMTAPEIDSVEISPVDQVALAIVKLFDQANLNNMVFHVFNPYLCQLSKLFAEQNIPIKMYTIDKFIDNLLVKLNTSNNINKEIELFMVHQLWLSENTSLTQIKVLQDKTRAILERLGFIWSKINKNMLESILNKHQ